MKDEGSEFSRIRLRDGRHSRQICEPFLGRHILISASSMPNVLVVSGTALAADGVQNRRLAPNAVPHASQPQLLGLNTH
jgi:hypothetical protein